MKTIRLFFSTRVSPFSALIRLATWSSWSHVALVDGDSVIESVALHGTRRLSLIDAKANASRWSIVDIPCDDPMAVIFAAGSQLGKPYDYWAVLGLGLRRNWQDDEAWFCSELIAWAFAQAGHPLFRQDALRRVTPEHLWMLAPAPELPELRFFPVLPD